jgi:hypothetical protein
VPMTLKHTYQELVDWGLEGVVAAGAVELGHAAAAAGPMAPPVASTSGPFCFTSSIGNSNLAFLTVLCCSSFSIGWAADLPSTCNRNLTAQQNDRVTLRPGIFELESSSSLRLLGASPTMPKMHY